MERWYNTLANQFINVYGLKNAKAALWVTLKVDVISASDEFEMNNENTHSVSMLIPLNELNFSIVAEERDRMQQLVIEEMQSAIAMSVPLTADYGWGANWLEAH